MTASPDFVVMAAIGGVCLALAAVLYAVWAVRAGDRRIAAYRVQIDRLQGLADATQASAEAFDSAMITVEGNSARLAWGGDTLGLCASALGVSPSDARAAPGVVIEA